MNHGVSVGNRHNRHGSAHLDQPIRLRGGRRLAAVGSFVAGDQQASRRRPVPGTKVDLPASPAGYQPVDQEEDPPFGLVQSQLLTDASRPGLGYD